MLTFRHHTYSGNPLFIQDQNALTIINDDEADRGSWIGRYQGELIPGELFTLAGSWGEIGACALVFELEDETYLTINNAAPGQFFTVPVGAILMRLDARLWRTVGVARFENLDLLPYAEPPEPEPEIEGLPVPPPDMAQKHHVTGYKWGRNIALLVHGDDIQPPDYGEDHPYEIKGWQHGSHLDLEIGRLVEDADDQEP